MDCTLSVTFSYNLLAISFGENSIKLNEGKYDAKSWEEKKGKVIRELVRITGDDDLVWDVRII